MTTCRNGAQFGKRCSKPAKWVLRINGDPDTDIELCTVHAKNACTVCLPSTVTVTPIEETK